jgi:hypothetical protein
MKIKIIEQITHITSTLTNRCWIVYLNDIEITKFTSYKEALNYSIQQYGHSAVFPS